MKWVESVDIKAKISIWYISFFLIIVAVALTVLFQTGKGIAENQLSEQLTEAVEDARKQIKISNGEIDIDYDDIDFLSKGIYLSVYDKNGVLVAGRVPSLFESNVSFFPESRPRLISDNGESWIVYDKSREKKNEIVYIRGIMSFTPANDDFLIVRKLSFILIPCLLIISALGGYLIIKYSFRPMEMILRTAAQIEESGDLSKRIGLPSGSDELHMIANSFDRLFEKLEQSFERERSFTSDASHELRTPVSVILSQSEYAIDHPENTDSALHEIQKQAQTMAAMISQLLLLTRGDRNTQTMSLEYVNLSELCEIVSLQQKPEARKNNITIHSNIEKDIVCFCDEILITRLLINLIENAISYGRDNGNVWISLNKMENKVVCSIKDDGIGMNESEQRRIWDRFYQADPARGKKGAGLGLPIAKWIVDAHNGAISVDSKPNNGSEFTFSLPC